MADWRSIIFGSRIQDLVLDGYDLGSSMKAKKAGSGDQRPLTSASLDPVSRAGQSAQERAPARLDQATKGDLLARNRIPKLERAISQQILEPLWLTLREPSWTISFHHRQALLSAWPVIL